MNNRKSYQTHSVWLHTTKNIKQTPIEVAKGQRAKNPIKGLYVCVCATFCATHNSFLHDVSRDIVQCHATSCKFALFSHRFMYRRIAGENSLAILDQLLAITIKPQVITKKLLVIVQQTELHLPAMPVTSLSNDIITSDQCTLLANAWCKLYTPASQTAHLCFLFVLPLGPSCVSGTGLRES